MFDSIVAKCPVCAVRPGDFRESIQSVVGVSDEIVVELGEAVFEILFAPDFIVYCTPADDERRDLLLIAFERKSDERIRALGDVLLFASAKSHDIRGCVTAVFFLTIQQGLSQPSRVRVASI